MGEFRSLVIVLPLPSNRLSPNGRYHWAAKHRAIKKARADAGLAVLVAKNAYGAHTPFYKVTVKACFYLRDSRKHDSDNLIASIKAYLDGMADAEVVANDNDIIPLPPSVCIDKSDPRLVLVVDEITQQAWEEYRNAPKGIRT